MNDAYSSIFQALLVEHIGFSISAPSARKTFAVDGFHRPLRIQSLEILNDFSQCALCSQCNHFGDERDERVRL